MTRTLWVGGLAAVVSLVLVLGGARGEKERESNRIDTTKALPPIDLAPLPEAPSIQAAPESLPGSDGALSVVVARPTGLALGNFRPTITFSKPIVPMDMVERERGRAAPATIDPPLPGESRWLGSATVEYVVKGLIPFSSRFMVTVPAGLRALDGTAFKEAYTYSFETPRPEVQQVERSLRAGRGSRPGRSSRSSSTGLSSSWRVTSSSRSGANPGRWT